MKKKIIALGFLVLFALLSFTTMGAIAIEDKDPSLNARIPPWLRDQAPAVDITAPSNGAHVEGVVLITVSASDDKGITSVVLTIDSITYDITATYTYNWDTSSVPDGDHTISAKATDTIGQTSTDTIIVETGEAPPPPPPPTGGKYAVIVGISDYKAISDLSYCDEDAVDWYNYLVGEGYEILAVLGDSHPDDYPDQYDGTASEYNIRNALAYMASIATEDDMCVFTTSGHGGQYKSGSGRNRVYYEYLCAWDCSAGEDGHDGIIWEDEMPAIFAPFVHTNLFLFFDHCYSGGFNTLMNENDSGKWYMTTTCTDDGYGWDDGAHLNGAWTYWFLEHILVENPTMSMEEAFVAALAVYPYDGGDTPQEFDGNTLVDFYLSF